MNFEEYDSDQSYLRDEVTGSLVAPLNYPDLHPNRNRVLSYVELTEEDKNRVFWLCRPNETIMENLQDIRGVFTRTTNHIVQLEISGESYIEKMYEDIKECVDIENENIFKFDWDTFFWALEFGTEDTKFTETYMKITKLMIDMGSKPIIWKHGEYPKYKKQWFKFDKRWKQLAKKRKMLNTNNCSLSKQYLKYIGDEFIKTHLERVNWNRNMYSLIDLKIFPEQLLETHLLV